MSMRSLTSACASEASRCTYYIKQRCCTPPFLDPWWVDDVQWLPAPHLSRIHANAPARRALGISRPAPKRDSGRRSSPAVSDPQVPSPSLFGEWSGAPRIRPTRLAGFASFAARVHSRRPLCARPLFRMPLTSGELRIWKCALAEQPEAQKGLTVTLQKRFLNNDDWC